MEPLWFQNAKHYPKESFQSLASRIKEPCPNAPTELEQRSNCHARGSDVFHPPDRRRRAGRIDPTCARALSEASHGQANRFVETGGAALIVVDTNIICYRCMASPYAGDADAAWQRDPQWIAPLLWRSEFRNALAGPLRKGLLTIDAAIEITNLAESLLAGREFAVSSSAILRLVDLSGCSAYDCEFVALAEHQNVPLITVDRQILREFPKRAIPLKKFLRR